MLYANSWKLLWILLGPWSPFISRNYARKSPLQYNTIKDTVSLNLRLVPLITKSFTSSVWQIKLSGRSTFFYLHRRWKITQSFAGSLFCWWQDSNTEGRRRGPAVPAESSCVGGRRESSVTVTWRIRMEAPGVWLRPAQLGSVAQSCQTLCDPMDCITPGFPVHHQLPELAQTHVHWVSDAIQPSHPLSSPSPPAFSLSQHQGFSNESALPIRWPKYLSFIFSINPSNEYSGLI